MFSIKACELPEQVLLQPYKDAGDFTDCYMMVVPRAVSQAEYIQHFYTTRLFKLEAFLLKKFLGKDSSDLQAGELSTGKIDSFSAWYVKGRTENQLLMSDFRNSTCSWLMTETVTGDNSVTTILYFGSAVVSKKNSKNGERSFPFVFHALLGFHKLYSRALLYSTVKGLLAEK